MKTRTAVLAITIIACAEPDRRDVGPLEPTSALRAVIPQHAIRRPQEDKFVALAAAVPSFGGYHYERGDLVISLTDPADSARAAALVARDGTGAGGSSHKDGRRTGRTRFTAVPFSFTQLKGWRDAMFDDLIESDSVDYIDLDERANVVAVGVTEDGAATWVRQLAAKAGLPARALRIETVPPGQAHALLRDRVRPVRAGLMIAQREGDLCTLGFVVRFVGTGGIETGFLTNSHCSDTFWGADQAPQFQVTGNITADSIGREVRDPAGFACGWRGRKTCRYSDAAILGAATTNRLLGAIARPTVLSASPSESFDPQVIDPVQPSFTVTGTTFSATVGDVLDKVGMATGWTSGEVNKTCVDLKDGTVSRNRLLCQDESFTFSFNGDSGSPMFVLQGSSAQAHGILWGGRVFLARPAVTWLSPLENVVMDLGGLTSVAP